MAPRRAACLIRPLPEFRRGAVVAGLLACGYRESQPLDRPSKDDAIVTWNRGAVADRNVLPYEHAGAPVIVAENGYLGREWCFGHWYALARDHHNGAGRWPDGGPERWDGWGVKLAPWRREGREIVVLAQRGIGHRDIRAPTGWARQTVQWLSRHTSRPVRLRLHPGKDEATAVPLEIDLRDAHACVTWSSGAALKALLLGVPVFYGCTTWIGRTAGVHIGTADMEKPFLGDRLPMFQRLAWAMFSTDEIATGEPLRCLFALPSM